MGSLCLSADTLSLQQAARRTGLPFSRGSIAREKGGSCMGFFDLVSEVRWVTLHILLVAGRWKPAQNLREGFRLNLMVERRQGHTGEGHVGRERLLGPTLETTVCSLAISHAHAKSTTQDLQGLFAARAPGSQHLRQAYVRIRSRECDTSGTTSSVCFLLNLRHE